MSTVTYRNIPENYGGVYTFTTSVVPKSGNHIPYIGTAHLLNCVGIYLPIDETRCFVAHINACAHAGGDQVTRDNLIPAQREYIRNTVFEKLTASANAQNWTRDDVLQCHRTTNRKIVVMCPYLSNAPGTSVLEGLDRFLGGRGLYMREYCDRHDVQGFVVDHGTGQVSVLQYGLPGERLTDGVRTFEKREEHLTWRPPDGDWIVVAGRARG